MFSEEYPKSLRFKSIGDLRFKSKMSADDAIRHFKTRAFLAIFNLTVCLFTSLFQGFSGIPIFAFVKCCAFK